MINVLIAEDEPPIARVVKATIEKTNSLFKVCDIAINGKRALEIVQDKKIDVVFTDIRMPVMDGLELSRKMNEIHPEIPVIILSGYSEFEYAQQAIQNKVRGYLLKPISQPQLEEMLNELENEINTDEDEGKPELIQDISHYIKKHYRQGVTNSELSEKYGFVPSYISKMFKQYEGVSPVEYLTKYRIEKAKELMKENSNLMMKEIADMVGYNDAHYFSKIFKKETGVWPTEFINGEDE